MCLIFDTKLSSFAEAADDNLYLKYFPPIMRSDAYMSIDLQRLDERDECTTFL